MWHVWTDMGKTKSPHSRDIKTLGKDVEKLGRKLLIRELCLQETRTQRSIVWNIRSEARKAATLVTKKLYCKAYNLRF